MNPTKTIFNHPKQIGPIEGQGINKHQITYTGVEIVGCQDDVIVKKIEVALKVQIFREGVYS